MSTRFTRRRVSLILLTIAFWAGVVVLPLAAILAGLDIPRNPFFGYLQYLSWLLPCVWTFIVWPWMDIAKPLDQENPPPAKILLRRFLVSSVAGWVLSMLPAGLILALLAQEVMSNPEAYPIEDWIYLVVRLVALGLSLAFMGIVMNWSAHKRLLAAFRQTKTCRYCGYNLSYSTSVDCSECGRANELETNEKPT